MQARDIERHLAQLGQELADRGVQKPIRVLMIGGAYMLLLAKMQRSTDDVDILWLDEDDAFQRAIDALREGVQAVAEKQRLEPDWFNYMTHLLIRDVVMIPRDVMGGLARHIYVPSKTYILAPRSGEAEISKIAVLLPSVRVKTRYARRLLDRHVRLRLWPAAKKISSTP
jgi:hypothetical protein